MRITFGFSINFQSHLMQRQQCPASFLPQRAFALPPSNSVEFWLACRKATRHDTNYNSPSLSQPDFRLRQQMVAAEQPSRTLGDFPALVRRRRWLSFNAPSRGVSAGGSCIRIEDTNNLNGNSDFHACEPLCVWASTAYLTRDGGIRTSNCITLHGPAGFNCGSHGLTNLQIYEREVASRRRRRRVFNAEDTSVGISSLDLSDSGNRFRMSSRTDGIMPRTPTPPPATRPCHARAALRRLQSLSPGSSPMP
jgi:hypothetical protein